MNMSAMDRVVTVPCRDKGQGGASPSSSVQARVRQAVNTGAVTREYLQSL